MYAVCGVKGELCVSSVWSEGWGVCMQCVERRVRCVYAACGVKGEVCVCSVWSEG